MFFFLKKYKGSSTPLPPGWPCLSLKSVKGKLLKEM